MPVFLNSSDAEFEMQLRRVLSSKREMSEEVGHVVSDILSRIQTKGDTALLELTRKFDHYKGDIAGLKVNEADIKSARHNVSEDEIAALELAAHRIEAYHVHQKPDDFSFTDDIGVEMGMRWSAIDAVGLYVPGGLASYPSSVLMNAIPAKVAGVSRMVMAVPAPNGQINPLVLVAAEILGITEIYEIGGAQAVGALAYGTKMIAPVDKIVGPGNAYVAAAKRQVFGTVGIDMIAGPSEVLIIADDSANTNWVAADLLAQAEHDTSAQSIVITTSDELYAQIDRAVTDQLTTLPKADIAGVSWAENGVVIKVNSLEEAAVISDRFAPEHLEIMTRDPDTVSTQIKHAGAIFLGHHTPEAIGDYIGGPNHVLPTARSARFSSGLSVFDFLKRTSILKCGPEPLRTIGEAATTLATSEDLAAHARSITMRLN